MADAARDLERIDAPSYSPIAGTDRGTADRIPRPSAHPGDAPDGPLPDLAALVRLGATKLEVGNDAEAEECFRAALEIGDRTLGSDHPDLIILLNDLTRIYLRQSAYAAAEPLLLRLFEMKRNKGEDHPEVATVLASLATVRQALGRHESAEQLWRRVLEIRERTLAPNHFAIATALEHFGEACGARGKIREALAAFQRAHTIRERTLGSEHPSLRSSRERIADLQLQASDDSLEPSHTISNPSPPDRFRLLSGEPVSPVTPPPSQAAREPLNREPIKRKPINREPLNREPLNREPLNREPLNQEPLNQEPLNQEPLNREPLSGERSAAPVSQKATVVIEEQFAENVAWESTMDRASVADETLAATVAMPSDVAPYHAALQSIREELGTDSDTWQQGPTFSTKVKGILATVIARIGTREIVAVGLLLVVASLSIALTTGSRALGEVSRPVDLGTALPTSEPLPPAVSKVPATPASGPLSLSPAVASGVVVKIAPQHQRAAEEKSAPRKVTEQSSEPKKLAIPTVSFPSLSSGIISRFDSVASRGANASANLAIQTAPISLGTQRTSFAAGGETSNGPQRARLIGELPSPRVPSEAMDVEGEVRVRFSVDTEGRPVMSTMSVVNSPNQLLTTAVKRVIPGIRFEPARTGGSESRVVGDVVEIGFRFARQTR